MATEFYHKIVPLCECEGCTYEVYDRGLCRNHVLSYEKTLVLLASDSNT